jgi:hypothetical protein
LLYSIAIVKVWMDHENKGVDNNIYLSDREI